MNSTTLCSRFWSFTHTMGALAIMTASGQDLNEGADRNAKAGELALPAKREQVVQALQLEANNRRALAHALAARQGWATELIGKNGERAVLVDLDASGVPLYLTTTNANAAVSTGANLIRQTSPYNVDGAGLTVGIWDGGAVLDTHVEFAGGRVTIGDGTTAKSDHATHVAGTIGASGVLASAKGMAPAVTISSYDFNSDTPEMTAVAAAVSNDPGKISISNHSYGFITGWYYGSSPPRWYGTWGDPEPRGFGQYSSTARSWDTLAYSAPYYLIFKSAGNDRNDSAPATGSTFSYFNGGWLTKTYNPATDPLGDGIPDGGFDSISSKGIAKNIVTVGAVNDAVSGGTRSPAAGTMSSFSGWGPTDDGRIKPDIVANGVSLTSSESANDSDYGSKSGTSMSSPNATGSALLLQDHWANQFAGGWMRAATMKGLLIHSADDIGNAGPDYANGWGLINVKRGADIISTHATAPATATITEDSVATTDTSDSFVVVSDGTTPLRATLCWTDPAGPAQTGLDSAAIVLVNDLDLRITGPGGTALPFILNPAAPNNLATTGDNVRDNVEQVLIPSPGAGSYTVTVNYKGAITNTTQNYSLIITGQVGGSGGTPELSISDANVLENLGAVSVSVSLNNPSATAVTVNYTTSDGSAIDGSDYSGASGSLNIPAGATGGSIAIPILDDGIEEGTESFAVTLSSPSGATIADGSASVAIIDNDSGTVANCRVAVFDNPSYVDTAGTSSSESDNIQAALLDLGHTVTTFTGITQTDWANAFAGADVVVIPELEIGDLNAALTVAAKNEIAARVAAGKGLLIMPDYTGGIKATSLLNDVFGWSLSPDSSYSSGLTLDLILPAPSGFEGAPGSLAALNGTVTLQQSSLPAGGEVIYQKSGDPSEVAVYRNGGVMYMGWEWFNPAQDTDGTWQQLLGFGILEIGCGGDADCNVAVFDNGSYVDTSVGGESDNVQSALSQVGHVVTTFSGITAADWTAAFASADVVVVPELEFGDLGAALTPAARAEIAAQVAAGKGLIHMGDFSGTNASSFLNSVFGWAVTPSTGLFGNEQLNRATPPPVGFGEAPLTLLAHSTTGTMLEASLPAGSQVIYEVDATPTDVAAFRNGGVVYLGWDWFGGFGIDSDGSWRRTLDLSVQEVGCGNDRGNCRVAVFDNPSYVDTSTGGESDNAQQALQELGHVVSTFTGITAADWSAAFAGADVVAVPELESGDLAAALTPAAIIEIAAQVAAGKGFVVMPDYTGGVRTSSLLNTVFGWAVTPASNYSSSTVFDRVSPAPAGFEAGPTALVAKSGTVTMLTASLPSGAAPAYQLTGDPSETAVFVSGTVGYFGWDYYNGAQDTDGTWREVLSLVMQSVGCGSSGIAASSDAPSEIFTAGDDLDVDGFSILFSPDGGGNYSYKTNAISSMPTDVTLGTTLISISSADDATQEVTLTAGALVPFFGTNESSLHVSSNGVISFGSGYSDFSESLAEHLPRRQIAVLWDDLRPASAGTIRSYQDTDRIVVSYDGVAEYFNGSPNTFQAELFFDGRIRLSYLGLGINDALIGLSPGGLVYDPITYIEEDFATGSGPAIQLTIADVTISEDGGTALVQVSLSETSQIPAAVDYATVAGSAEDGTDYLGTSGSLFIPAGTLFDTISVPIIDEFDVEADESFTISLTNPLGAELADATATVTITNDDVGLDANCRVAVFDDPAYVDSSGGIGAESDNVQQTLTALGHIVTTFVGTTEADWTTAFAEADVVVIPELEIADLSAALDAATKTMISTQVANGKGLVIFPRHGGADRSLTLLNSVFGWSLAAGGNYFSSESFNAVLPPPVGFEGAPSPLIAKDGSATVLQSSLPSGTQEIYTYAGTTPETVIFRNGGVAYMGWDWYNSVAQDTNDDWAVVLDLAVQAVSCARDGADCQVAIFNNPSYIDTSIGGEFDNMQQDITNLGHTLTTFTGITTADWTAAFASADVVVIPELELGDLGADLSAAARAEIASQVAAGKGLVITPDYSGGTRVSSLLNSVFGWSVAPSGAYAGIGVFDLVSPTATGFSDAPSSLTALNGSVTMQQGSLPSGTEVIYELSGDSTNAAAFRNGGLIYLGWDWYNSTQDVDGSWRRVLDLAIQEVGCGDFGVDCLVAVFDNPAFVDTSVGGESDQVQQSLINQGHAVVTFSGITAADWTAAFAGSDVLLIPELELGDLNAALSPAARAEIASQVASGKGFIVFAQYGGGSRSNALMNSTFGWSVATASSLSSGVSYNLAGPPPIGFAGAPTLLAGHSGTDTIQVASLPPSTSVIYTLSTDATQTSVFRNGGVGFVGWDWFNADSVADSDWDVVLDRLVQAVGCGVADGSDIIADIADSGLNESAAGVILVPVSLNAVPATDVMIDYATANIDAISGQDYLSAVGTLTIPAGSSSGTIPVTILDDLIAEGTQAFTLTLSNPVGTTLGDSVSIISITDNDVVALSIADASVSEAGGTVSISVSTNIQAEFPVTVGYSSSNGTAQAGSDYISVSDSLIFAPGSTLQTFDVTILEDLLVEGTEDFALTLGSPSGAIIGDGTASISIIDNDATPGLGGGAGCVIAVFDNPAFVDTANTTGAESDNVQQSLTELGYSVTTFTGIDASDWNAAFTSAAVVVIPELENGVLSSALSGAAMSEIASQVASGKGLVAFGGVNDTITLLNATFGWSISPSTGYGSNQPIDLLAPVAFGFSGAPISLLAHSWSPTVSKVTLPVGSDVVYQMNSNPNDVMVFKTGGVSYLGWDWWNSASQDVTGDWKEVLDLAVQSVACGVTTTSSAAPHEQFTPGADALDVDSFSLLFTPDGGGNYSYQALPITSLPTDPTLGTVLAAASGADDLLEDYTLTGGATFPFFGSPETVLRVSSNGVVGFGATASSDFSESVAEHFARRQIAVLWDDLHPASGGTIRVLQSADRVTVSYDQVLEIGTTNPNTCQAELFFDGRIRLSYYGISIQDGLVGLSPGGLVPGGSDLEEDFVDNGLRIVDYQYNATTTEMTVTWTSHPGYTYEILTAAGAVTPGAFSPAVLGIGGASAGTTTTHSFFNPTPGASKVFVKVRSTAAP